MQIIRFEAQNIQRLSAVTIEPGATSPAVVLAGGNEEGKSSCLDAIEMALAGERTHPPEPLRRGQDKGHVVVDLGDIIVTRRFTKSGSTITVTNREGLRYPSPQSLLDGLYNKLTFDPLEFAASAAAEQAAILRRIAGLDTADLEAARKAQYELRTLVNRDITKAKGALDNAPSFDEVGTELEDGAAVLQALADADKIAGAVSGAERVLANAVTAHKLASAAVNQAITEVDFAKAALASAEQRLEAAHLVEVDTEAKVDEARAAAQAAAAAVPDRAALRAKVADVQARNQKAEGNRKRADLAKDLEALQAEAAGHTKRIEELDAQKVALLAAAKFPIEGLGLSDAGGVTWSGLPFEQASTAIRTRVSVAIGFAMHPKLKVLLVRNGNDLDAKNLKLLADAAAESGGQLWIERIAGGDGLQTVVIEDGAVRVPETPVLATAGLPLDGGAQ